MATRFVDARGTEWEVWEVQLRPVLADIDTRDRGTEQGGLWFESATQRRRLARYPRWWHALGSHDLAQLCESATPDRSPAFFRPSVRKSPSKTGGSAED